jgi:ketosteroid isomerase-like protein
LQSVRRETEQVMSKNVELVRECLNAWIEVDEGLAESRRMDEFFARDAVFAMEETFLEGGELHGVDEFLEWRAGWIESFDDWTYRPEKIVDAGANRVVGLFYQRGKLRHSSSWIEMRYGIVYCLEGGLITGGKMYMSPEGALEAVGLSE